MMNISGIKIDELHFISPIQSVESIMKHGILSNHLARSIQHISVADEEVQQRRNRRIPNDGPLHSYANLYFCARNPMLYKIKCSNSHIVCILQVSPAVLNLPDTIITDMNAACDYVKFLPVDEINQLDFNRIHAKYWNDEDSEIKAHNKKIKCAEALIKNKVEPKYINGAYVKDLKSKTYLQQNGFNKTICIDNEMFFGW